MNKAKSVTPLDIQIGARIRKRRLRLGMSQEELGRHLNLTFQQVQKYEKGLNRIAVSRLAKISEVLGASIDAFFDEQENKGLFLDADLQTLVDKIEQLPSHLRKPLVEMCTQVVRSIRQTTSQDC